MVGVHYRLLGEGHKSRDSISSLTGQHASVSFGRIMSNLLVFRISVVARFSRPARFALSTTRPVVFCTLRFACVRVFQEHLRDPFRRCRPYLGDRTYGDTVGEVGLLYVDFHDVHWNHTLGCLQFENHRGEFTIFLAVFWTIWTPLTSMTSFAKPAWTRR